MSEKILEGRNWEKLGCLLKPGFGLKWLESHSGPSFVLPNHQNTELEIYITGRDSLNRSHIGKAKLDLVNLKISDISENPIFTLGVPGTFDESGVCYPCIVPYREKLYMYYVGCIPSVLTPFQADLGLAIQSRPGSEFLRHSNAPILPRTNDDPLGTGSSFILFENGRWRMWYTCFLGWGKTPTEPKHWYSIKYAESCDGINWVRNSEICIPFRDEKEFCIARPSVLKRNGVYHMWYSSRGERYRIGYAISDDGIHWNRHDQEGGLSLSASGWDSLEQSFSHVFEYQSSLYMIYCGNNYGNEGLGLAKYKCKFQ